MKKSLQNKIKRIAKSFYYNYYPLVNLYNKEDLEGEIYLRLLKLPDTQLDKTLFNSICKRACIDFIRKENKGFRKKQLVEYVLFDDTDPEYGVENKYFLEYIDLKADLDNSNERRKSVLKFRLLGYNDVEIGKVFGVHASRIYQIIRRK